jgi:predicted chitinase
MDAATLVRGHISADYAAELIGPCDEALRLADCTTVNRAAMFLAQIAEESVQLRYREEIASGAAYEGRADLGNTQPGDGVRFKGRSFIQITGRHNYTSFSAWAHAEGLVSDPLYFVNHPEALADVKWAWMGPVWYWTVARPQLNSLADAGDIVGATKAVNGGTNGLNTRTYYWNLIRGLGAAILPDTGDDVVHPKDWTKEDIDFIRKHLMYPHFKAVRRMVRNAVGSMLTKHQKGWFSTKTTTWVTKDDPK